MASNHNVSYYGKRTRGNRSKEDRNGKSWVEDHRQKGSHYGEYQQYGHQKNFGKYNQGKVKQEQAAEREPQADFSVGRLQALKESVKNARSKKVGKS